MDLDQIRLKTSSQLDDNERDFIRENQDKLTDEDKDAYASFLNVEETSGEEASETVQDSKGQEVPSEEGEAAPVSPVAPEPPTPPTDSFSFKSEEEAKEFIRKQSEENERQKQAAIDAAQSPEEKKWVEDNWKPKTWNEGIKTVKDIVKQELKEEQEEERVKAEGVRLAKEWDEIVAEKQLPNLSTNEGRAIHDSVVRFGIAAKKQNFKDAYEVWEKVPKQFGGGLDETVSPPADPVVQAQEEQKAKAEAARKAASKLGGQNPGGPTGGSRGSSPLKSISYEDLKKGRGKLIKEALNG